MGKRTGKSRLRVCRSDRRNSDREAKLQLVKALLAHGANPNLQMTARPPGYGGTGTGGYNDARRDRVHPRSQCGGCGDDAPSAQAGADPHIVTKTNSNALLAATALNRGSVKLSTTRIGRSRRSISARRGCRPEGVTTYNENALFGPAYRGWNKMIELLIEKGAEVNVVNKAGVTPWLAASGFGDRLGGVLFNKEGADVLLKHGADPKLGHPCQAQNRCRGVTQCEHGEADADDGVRIDRARRDDLGDPVGRTVTHAGVFAGQCGIRNGANSRSSACDHVLCDVPQPAREDRQPRARQPGRRSHLQLGRHVGKVVVKLEAARCRRRPRAGPTTRRTTAWPRGSRPSWIVPPPPM